MKKSRIILVLGMLTILSGISGYYTVAEARKQEVVDYLRQRFQSANLPVTDIEVIELTPLRIQIVVQSLGDYITPEDSINLHKVDREVFIVARKNDYYIERYTRILRNNKGEQLYKADLGTTYIQQAIEDMGSPGKSDNEAKKILADQINLWVEEYQIQETKAKIDVSTIDGGQYLEITFEAPSIEEAYKVFGFLSSKLIYPKDSLIVEVNAQDGRIVMCMYKIEDAKKNTLFFYFFDYELQKGTWSNMDNFEVDLGGGGPPSIP